jgi:hypothetical protein
MTDDAASVQGVPSARSRLDRPTTPARSSPSSVRRAASGEIPHGWAERRPAPYRARDEARAPARGLLLWGGTARPWFYV